MSGVKRVNAALLRSDVARALFPLRSLGLARELCRAPKHPYTQALLSAVPVVDPDSKRQRIILAGDVPSPIHPPGGCPFHPRCPVAEARCKTEVPPLKETSSGHRAACHRVK